MSSLYRIPIYKISLVRESALTIIDRPVIRHSAKAAEIAREYLGCDALDREHFGLMLLDAKNRVIGIHTVSVGSLTSALVHPREVLKPIVEAVVQHSAAALILFHNYPSGEPQPSQEDLHITRRIREVCEVLGVRILDHVVLGEGTRFVSFVEAFR